MKIEAVSNKGPASMGPQIMEQMEWARDAYIASAFVSKVALERIEDSINNNKKLSIKLLVGLYQRFITAATLSGICKLQKKYPDNFTARIARNSRFHWKLYAFKKGNSSRVYVGSANFTEDGLNTSGELSVKISAYCHENICKALDNEFGKIWNSPKHSFKIDHLFVRKYRKFARHPRFIRSTKDDPIAKFLINPQRPPRKQPKTYKHDTIVKTRLVYAPDHLNDETEAQLSKYRNNWEENGWGYVCLSRPYFEYTKKSSLMVFVTHDQDKIPSAADFEIGIYKVEDSAELKTPDGKYFVAYSHIPYSKIVRYGDVKTELRSIGLTWRRLKGNRFLNKEKMIKMCALFHMKWTTLIRRLA